MGPPKGLAPDVRIEYESAFIPPLQADDDYPPEGDEVPSGAFCLVLKGSRASLRSLRGGLGTIHAATLVDPRRCTSVNTRTFP